MSVHKQLETLSEDLNEIMSSTAHVKGAEFANAVAINFEAMQLSEVIGTMAKAIKSRQKLGAEDVDAMQEICINVLFSIIMKGMNIPEDDFDEASKLAKKLHDRRVGVLTEVQQELRKK